MEKEFLEKLKALLKEYNADICFGCHWSSDTHGLYEERIEVHMNDKEITRADGWYLSAGDL